MLTVVDSLSHKGRPCQSVQFSESSQLVLYQTIDHVQWDSIADKARFKRDIRRDVQRIQRVVANSSAEDVSQDDISMHRD